MNLLSRRKTRLFAGHVLPDVFRARKLICSGDYAPHFIMRPVYVPRGPVIPPGNQNEDEDTPSLQTAIGAVVPSLLFCLIVHSTFSQLLARFPVKEFAVALWEPPKHKSLRDCRASFYDIEFLAFHVTQQPNLSSQDHIAISMARFVLINCNQFRNEIHRIYV